MVWYDTIPGGIELRVGLNWEKVGCEMRNAAKERGTRGGPERGRRDLSVKGKV